MLGEALALVVALAVGDGEPVFVGEPVDESVADSVGVALEERDALGVMPATDGSFTSMSEMVTTASAVSAGLPPSDTRTVSE